MKYYCAVILLFQLVTVNTCYAEPPAKDAIKSLKKIALRCDSGVSYDEYSYALKDTEIEVNEFLSTTENPKSELATTLLIAVSRYSKAKLVWDWKITNKGVTAVYTSGTLFDDIPEAYKPASQGGVLSEDGNWVMADEAIRYFWMKGKIATQVAENLSDKKKFAKNVVKKKQKQTR